MSTPSDVDFIQFDEIDPVTNQKAVIPLEAHPTKKTKAGNPLMIIPQYWLQKRNPKHPDRPTFRKGQENKEFAITIEDSPVIDTLREEPFGFSIATKGDEKQRFKDVILAINDIENESGIMTGKGQYDLEASPKNKYFVEGFGATPMRYKLLDMSARLFGKKTKRTRTPRSTSILQKDKKKFEADPKIKDWLEHSPNTQDRHGDFTQPLKNALYVLDMSPDEILQGDPNDPRTQRGDDFSKGAFLSYMTRLVQETPTWTDVNGKKWNLWDWSMAGRDERVDIAGEGNKQSKKGQQISYKKVSKTARKGSTQARQNIMTALKHYLGYHGKVGEAQMVGTIFEKPSPTLNYPALRLTAKQLDYLNDCLKNPKGDPEFAEQDKADGKIRFKQESYYQTEESDEDDEFGEPVDTGVKKILTFETTREDWEDAYLFYRIALETGWRAYEGLSMTVNFSEPSMLNPSEPLNTAIYHKPIKVGEDELAGGMMVIKFLTRKTWKNKRYTHSEFIGVQGDETRTLIEQKMNKIQEGIAKYNEEGWSDEKILETYGVARKLPDGKPNHDHALIGSDGKYIRLGTYKYPTSHGLTATKKAELEKAGGEAKQFERVTKDGENVERTLIAIIRKCIVDSGVDLYKTWKNKKTGLDVKIGQYWVTNTMHSLRHVFAQYWLFKSSHNFSFVATKGHWAGTKILEDAYGGTSDDETLAQNVEFQAVDIHTMEAKRANTTDPILMGLIEKNKKIKSGGTAL